MKLFRFRKPSIKTIVGITKLIRHVKKYFGIYKVTKILNYPANLKRKVLRNVGYYSTPMKILRNGLPQASVISALVKIVSFIQRRK